MSLLPIVCAICLLCANALCASETKRDIKVTDLLTHDVLSKDEKRLPVTIALNVNNPTEEELKQVRLKIVEIDFSGAKTERDAYRISSTLSLALAIPDNHNLKEIRLSAYIEGKESEGVEASVQVRELDEGEIVNVGIYTIEGDDEY
jgi:hypothetical protein